MESGENEDAATHNADSTVKEPASKGEGKHQDNGPHGSCSKSIAPIYWQHRRYESYASVGHTKPSPILLEDNAEAAPDIMSPLWAKAVVIDDFTIVSGSVPGVGDYTTWNCIIDTLDVSNA